MLRVTLLAAGLAGLSSTAFAEGHAIGLKAGGLGLGLEYTYELNDRFALRGGINGSEIGVDSEESGIRYDFDVVWDSLSFGVDFHPGRSAFRLSGGVLSSDNRLEAVGRTTSNVTIGNDTYTPAEVGTLSGVVAFDDTAPYFGLGWDWSRSKRRFGVSLDLGVLDQGKPRVTLTGSGTLLGDPSFEQDLRREAAELEDSLADLDLIPYATLGFLIRF